LLVDEYNETTGLTKYHGLCGLSPKILSDYSELVVSAWAAAGTIPKSMFSINYKSYEDTSTSYIYFGGYESSIVSSESDITWFKITESGFWEIEATNVFYGDSKRSLGNLKKAIIDTGSEISYVPSLVLIKLVSDTGLDCDDSYGLYVCSCKGISDFEDLYFGFGDEPNKVNKIV